MRDAALVGLLTVLACMSCQSKEGPIGSTGAQGPVGPQGAQGVQGPQGPSGPAPGGTGFAYVVDGVLDPNGKLVDNSDVSDTARIAESKLALSHPTHSNRNDPSAAQWAALAGTSGAPSADNAYVTASDPRLVAESFETEAFATPPGGSESKTIAFQKPYVSTPKVLLTWNNTGAILYEESFEAMAVAQDMTLHQWTYHPLAGHSGTFKVVDGKAGELRVTSGDWTGGYLYAGPGAADWGNVSISFDVASMAGGRVIIGFRCGAAGCYWLQVLPNQANECRLMKGGRSYPDGAVNLASATAPAALHRVKVVAAGSTLQVFLNDAVQPILEATDSSFPTGSIGLAAYGWGWQVDNLSVTNGSSEVFPYIQRLSTSEVKVGIRNGDPMFTATGRIQGIVFP